MTKAMEPLGGSCSEPEKPDFFSGKILSLAEELTKKRERGWREGGSQRELSIRISGYTKTII